MTINKKILRLIVVFFLEELKIIKIKIQYVITFYKEVNVSKYIFFKIICREKTDIFKNNNQNKYISKIQKLSINKNFKIVSKKKIYIESFINHPIYTITNCYISRIVSDELGRDCWGILRSGDIKGTKIMNSFGINKITYLNEGNFFTRLYYLVVAYNHLIKIKNIRSLIELKIDKIQFGLAIYEQYIRFKKRTDIYEINLDFYYLLSRALNYNSQFKNIFKNDKNTYLIQSETQYFPFRICLQNSLKYKNKIISRRGISNVSIRVYQKYSEKNENRNKISKKIFNYIYKNLNLKNHHLISDYFKKLIHKKIGKDIYQLNVNNNKKIKVFRSKNEIYNFFEWDKKKPIVLILAHELSDGNTNNKWNLFQNDMFWIMKTIKNIKKIKDINWLIKAHPSENIYNSKINTKSIFKEYCYNQSNIKLFPENFESKNLNKFISAALTSHGSAGYEYPGLGIPTIICGDTPYSELGFTIEPKTKAQYFEFLKNIKTLKKLNSEKIKKSKCFYYLLHNLTTAKIPIIKEDGNIRMNYSRNKFWSESLKLLKKYKLSENEFSKSLKFQLKVNNSILLNTNKLKNFKKIYKDLKLN
jgi:hypothetical protein